MTRPYDRRTLLRWSSASLVGLAGCAAPRQRAAEPGVEEGPAAWPAFQYDRRNTGHAANRDGPASVPDTKWTFETDDQIWGSPVTDGNRVYVGSYDHALYALDPTTGRPDWQFETGDRIDGTPSIRDGRVYFGSFDGSVYALDAETGDERWSIDAHGRVRGSPTVVDGTVYIGANCRHLECNFYYDDDPPEHGHVFALDAETGDTRWEYTTGDGIMSTPSVDGGTLYIGSADGTVHALDAESGDEQWEYVSDDMVMSSPTIGDETVYFGSNDATVYALDAASGRERWTFDTEGQYVSSSPSVYDGTVYIGSSGVIVEESVGPNRLGGVLFALDAGSGDERWAFETAAQEVGSTPAIVADRLYVGSHSENERFGGLYAIDPRGTERWVHEVDGVGIGASPAVADGTIYFAAANGTVYALD